MKKITKILGSVLIACGILFSACSDILDTDTDRFVLTEDNDLGSANDTLYSMLGILKQMRAIGDRYVVLGELRADLMDITNNSSKDLQDINNIDYSNSNNPYYSTKEYFSIINNCNYYISKVDTSIMVGGKDVMLIEYAAIKALRAWTYMQLVLNYGKAPYIDKPILTVDEMNKDYPVVDIYGLADLLIQDLTPYEYLEYPEYAIESEVNGTMLSYSLIPIPYLLGDLYLWKGDYENAALHYHRLISGNIIPNPRSIYSLSLYTASWNGNPVIAPETSSANCSYGNLFGSLTGEVYSIITDDTGVDADIMKIMDLTNFTNDVVGLSTYTYELAPSKVAMDNWNNSRNAYWNNENSELSYLTGDMRGNVSRIYSRGCSNSYSFRLNITGDTIPMINKYSDRNCAYLYRNTTLYLRYAEALNRAKKPTVALAVLKDGLSESKLQNLEYIDQTEVGNEVYLQFPDVADNAVIGIHRRGSGSADQDTLYVIPAEKVTVEEKMDYVEKLIIEELALETAFEGNRFHDLMRFAKRRGTEAEGGNILSNLVRKKNSTAGERLETEANWYLPYKYIEEVPDISSPETPEE